MEHGTGSSSETLRATLGGCLHLRHQVGRLLLQHEVLLKGRLHLFPKLKVRRGPDGYGAPISDPGCVDGNTFLNVLLCRVT